MLVALTEAVPTAANIEYYAKLVRSKSILRRLIDAGTNIVKSGFDGGDAEAVLDDAEQMVLDVRKTSDRRLTY